MFRVSCIQLKSNNDINHNIKKTEKFIIKAVKQNADFILTPEVSSLFSLNKKQLLKVCTSMKKDIYLNRIRILAKKYKKWILIGSVIIKISKNKLVNRSVSNKEKYFESKTFSAGNKIKSFNLPWGKLGLSICYDLRFPNLYRKLSKAGSLFLSIPSAFTETTGSRHWHSLLRARAIENYSYVFAPAQGGVHYNGRKTFGHSMIVSPDGKILKELKKSEGVITNLIDPKLPKKLRLAIPSLKAD
jgi:predicted amidohydrolase